MKTKKKKYINAIALEMEERIQFLLVLSTCAAKTKKEKNTIKKNKI